VESLLLACAGGLAGLVVSFAGARAIIDLAFRGATNIPVDPSPSPTVLGFAFAVSLLTGAVFGAAPAIIGSRSDPLDAMRGAGRTTGERATRLRRSLIALQVALSLVLMTCAGLLGRSLQQLQSQDFGFRLDSRYVVALAPSLSTVPPEQLPSMYARMQESLLRVPNVTNAAFSLYAPMSGDNWSSSITVDGHDTSERLSASWNRVSPRYFDTVGTPLVRGRAFDERDRPESPRVAIVGEAFARKFFGDKDPLGRRIGFGDNRGVAARDLEIVGVVKDAKYQDGRKAAYATFFLPFLQTSSTSGALGGPVKLDRSHYAHAIEIHTTAAVPALEAEVRRALAGVDRRITVQDLLSMDEQIARAFNLERLIARLTVAFGLVALLLACVGLYGVTAYSVSSRTREIGVRMAIGATRSRVLQNVLGGAIVQVAIGIAIGLPAAFVAGRLLQAQLFGVSGHDLRALGGGTVLLGLSALVAALIPARRAATMDPVTALRIE
jgi:predicted permease